MAQFDTALNVLNSAGKELGVIASTVSNPYGETDQNIVQLCSLLTRVGRMLARARAWVDLTKEHTLSTADGTASYALPADFVGFKDATSWNRTSQHPNLPVSGPQWQMVKAQTSTGMVAKLFRVWRNELHIYPTPSAVETVAFEYRSSRWVAETGQSTPNETTADATTDTLWFDEALLVAGLKLAWLRAKQMDTTYAQAEFDEVYRAAAGGDGVAPILNLTGGFHGPFLDETNLPDSEWGS